MMATELVDAFVSTMTKFGAAKPKSGKDVRMTLLAVGSREREVAEALAEFVERVEKTLPKQ